MFKELTITEMNGIDGGNAIIDFCTDVAKAVVKKIAVDTIYKGIKTVYERITDPNHYIGKPDYRTWLNTKPGVIN
jgi:bacteriocin-like protein